ncbi:tRNA1(Val) (adenine(37)-N6)-methyltransferase [Liquorilactobacillus cacaonum]|uniref:Methyltransferase n=1 Tax=Liquorilactobacillus cacaonum DSM 21116 TaxID=1423729 RepID=A0A0R2CHG3_9LACO|nr:tRNA1(Val) (adenine(37)-N6)-methyltransferase [Liquorilactobacillus cacaonum]KRM91073.1 methyltransferase [Liquorilactobacillus cacaonum DSM 21116]
MELYKNERIDRLYSNEVQIIQSAEVFSFSLDAVLLAYFTGILRKKNGLLVDLCAGNGAVGLFLTKKISGQIIEIEIQERLADMAQRSIVLNNLESRVKMLNIDLNKATNYIKKDSVDIVTCNPPYFSDLPTSKKNDNEYLAIARHEISVNLERIIEVTSDLLKMNGKAYFVHRPERAAEIFELMRNHRLAPKKVQLVHPKKEKEANMILIEAIKDGRPNGVRFLPAIVVYEKENEYTPLLKEILYGNKE